MLSRPNIAAVLLCAFPALSQGAGTVAARPVMAPPAPSLESRVVSVLAAAPPGTRFGLLVQTMDGQDIIAIDSGGRYIPASNTKMFTTAAAYALLPGINSPDSSGGAGVRLEKGRSGDPAVVLFGYGDARLSSAAACVDDCLARLADAVAAKVRKVGDVIGDDSWFPDQRWSPGMSWNNIGTDSGTAISALSLDDNEIPIQVSPTAVGQPPKVELSPYFHLNNQAVTVAEGPSTLAVERAVNGDTVRLYGQIPISGGIWLDRLGIDDPAHYAAWNLRTMLAARGVRLKGGIGVRHRPVGPPDDPAQRGATAFVQGAMPQFLARLVPQPLSEDVVVINKVSQNLHAELLLRRLGALTGSGSLADGTAALRAVLEEAGIPRSGFDFSDGSGMSSYNRMSPRAAAGLLRWIASQPWNAAWRASLPVGGVDGTLKHRFSATLLEGNLQAKTGTLNASNTLSGFMKAASGRELVFSILAGDVPDGANVVPVMDAALRLIAQSN